MDNKDLSLTERFQQYFSVEFADTPEQKQKAYHIRYRVYCEEFGYEPAERFPDKAEYDEYDDTALHCLITHRATGTPAGSVRIVPATGVDGLKLLMPFEKHCGASIDHDFVKALQAPRNTMCEISRLAIDGQFRRRSGEVATRFGKVEAMDFSNQDQRAFSLISVAAFLATTALTDLTGRTNAFAMMEPFLPRLLTRSGIYFQRAGSDLDYHGIRAPYFITTQAVLAGMQAELQNLYDEIHATFLQARDDWANI